MYLGVYDASGGATGVVEAPFGWSELDSAILAVAKRGKLPRMDGLISGIRAIAGKGATLIVKQRRE
jgi:hypothetical protein